MPRKGLSNIDIVEAALSLIAEKGYEAFSLRELSQRLHISPSSLYNHIDGIGELSAAVADRVSLELKDALSKAADGKSEDEGFLAAARAYRRFALENPELYKAFMDLPQRQQTVQTPAFHEILQPINAIVRKRLPEGEQALHFMRSLRAALHGFVTLESAGFMHKGHATPEESFDFLLQEQLHLLYALSSGNRVDSINKE